MHTSVHSESYITCLRLSYRPNCTRAMICTALWCGRVTHRVNVCPSVGLWLKNRWHRNRVVSDQSINEYDWGKRCAFVCRWICSSELASCLETHYVRRCCLVFFRFAAPASWNKLLHSLRVPHQSVVSYISSSDTTPTVTLSHGVYICVWKLISSLSLFLMSFSLSRTKFTDHRPARVP